MFKFRKNGLSVDNTLPIQDRKDEATTKSLKRNRFINLHTFVLVSGVLMCAQNSLSIYTKSVLTSIERRFQISSSLAGLIVGSFNFGNMLFVVLVSKLSTNGHRPRIMATGSLVIALGGFLNVIPHLIIPTYDPVQLTSTNVTNVSAKDASTCSSSNAYILLIVGEMLQGIGATVLIPLGSSYIDDFAKSGKSPLYLGIMFLLQNLGPGVGYLVGSLTTLLYVDFNKVDSDQIFVEINDDSWVGAWWLGYIIISIFVVICAAPLFWFPRTMDTPETVGKKTIHEIKVIKNAANDKPDKDDSVLLNGTIKKIYKNTQVTNSNRITTYCTNCETFLEIFIDLYQVIKRLIMNPVYICVVMGYSGLMFVVGALTAFMPKFLEVVFYQTKSQASLIFGLSMPIVICIGLFSGGFIVQRSKLDAKQTMRFIVCASGITVFLCIPAYYVTCDVKSIDNCSDTTITNGTRCIDDRSVVCKPQCYAFVAIMALSALLCCHIVTPSYSVILRTVNPKDKCIAIGLKFLIIRLVAFIPSPMITGAVIDNTCTKWSKSPGCVGTATCLMHDRNAFRYSYLHIIVLGVVATCFFNFIGCIIQHRITSNSNRNSHQDEADIAV